MVGWSMPGWTTAPSWPRRRRRRTSSSGMAATTTCPSTSPTGIVVGRPHRAGHETTYHPGEANLRRAHVVVINKVDTAFSRRVARVRASIRELKPTAVVVEAASPIFVEEARADPRPARAVRWRTVHPHHVDMTYGAGVVARAAVRRAEVVDPRSYAVVLHRRCLRSTRPSVPCCGHGLRLTSRMRDLEATIARTPDRPRC